ncbi:MAG: corrinoid protein-associated methyltransferase CpaM [Desulfobacterales bacterium]
MFSYVFMKILEMRPRSYDQQMDKISRGRVRAAKEAVAGKVPEGSRVLEIGCGTGELASLLIQRGAFVEGFDLNPSMIRTAKERIETENLAEKFSVSQMGVDAMDRFREEQFDAIVSTLVFSELSDDERRFALKQAKRILKPGGMIIIADEVVPKTLFRKLLHTVTRLPMLALTYLVSSSSTRPILDLSGELAGADFSIQKEIRSHGDSFAMTVGIKEKGEK